MTILQKTRKILWAKSGNRCAFCKTELVMDGSIKEQTAVVGDECHIVSKSRNGPRGNYVGVVNHDELENLTLLCKNHHKLIDDQANTYTVERLKYMKSSHETWVHETLRMAIINDEEHDGSQIFLVKLDSGQELMSYFRGAHLYQLLKPELNTQGEVNLIGELYQLLDLYGNILDVLEPAEIIQAEFIMKKSIENLKTNGFWVFAGRVKRLQEVLGIMDLWDIAIISIAREDDPIIIKIDLENLISRDTKMSI